MQQAEPNYAEINPYLLIYCNMNLRVAEGITPDTAENVARQLGYLYNAFGHVTKDLIKIVAQIMPKKSPAAHHQAAHSVPPSLGQQKRSSDEVIDVERPPQPQQRVPPPQGRENGKEGVVGEGKNKLAGNGRKEGE